MENEKKTFLVTIEALKRTQIEVTATDFEGAQKEAEAILADKGVEGIVFDEMWDSIKITHASIKPETDETVTEK